MGMSNRHWNPPLRFEDFEFENDRLVKIRGMRPMYMDGYKLIAAVEAMSLIARDMKAEIANLQENYLKLANLTPPDIPTIGQAFVDRTQRKTEPTFIIGMDFGKDDSIGATRDLDSHVMKIIEIKQATADADPSGSPAPESGSVEDNDGW